METTPFWIDTAKLPAFSALNGDLRVDALVIGAGITGITAAYLLKKAGRTVALIERGRAAMRDTGHTTAHLTVATDTRLGELTRTFGRNHAQAAWEAGAAAIEQIETVVREEQIECELAQVPGYLHEPFDSSTGEDAKALREDADLAAQMGFDATFLPSVPLIGKPGVRFSNQRKFHPRKYLGGLLGSIAGNGSHVFEQTEAEEFHESPLGITANGHRITCDFIVVATHVPLQGNRNPFAAALLQTKLAPYSSYVVGAKLPPHSAPEALFWDTGEPYNYLRIERRDGHEYAILGGQDHRTGQESDTFQQYRRLEELLLGIFPQALVDHHWSGQVIETPDGLPYIGIAGEGQFISAGYAGNGMTFGTVGAMMARDAMLEIKNPWSSLFDPHRKKLTATWDYLLENKDYPFYLVRDRLRHAAGTAINDVRSGEGKILRLDGKKVAAYRGETGAVTTLSPVCPHLGCIVHWNGAEQTWDCPCHGSRFKPTGEVIGGPAETGLARA